MTRLNILTCHVCGCFATLGVTGNHICITHLPKSCLSCIYFLSLPLEFLVLDEIISSKKVTRSPLWLIENEWAFAKLKELKLTRWMIVFYIGRTLPVKLMGRYLPILFLETDPTVKLPLKSSQKRRLLYSKK